MPENEQVRQTTGTAARDINPLRVPHYPAIAPHSYNACKNAAIPFLPFALY